MVWPILISVAVTPRISAASDATDEITRASAASAANRVAKRIGTLPFSRHGGRGSARALGQKHAMAVLWTPTRMKRRRRAAGLAHRDRGQAEAAIVDGEIAEGIADHCRGMKQRHLLRHHAEIDVIAPQILEAIEPEPVAAARDQGDIA